MCILIAGCAAPDLGAPQYAQDDCTVRRLTDSLTGETVSGAEDLAQDGEHVWVSAYDRLAAEEALQKGRTLADGGLYRISLQDLVRGDVDVASALDPDAIGGLRPHGIAAKDNRLAVVNRRGGADRAQAVLEIYDIEEGRLRPRLAISNAAYCAANDVEFSVNGALLLTLDRRQCPGWAFDERYLAAAKATLISVDPLNPAKPAAIVSSNLSLANGIVGLDDGRLIVAETRGGRLRIVGTAGPPTTWLTPGSPDNLTRTSNGAIIAAVQPNLIAFGRYRFGHANRVASRIVGSNTAGSPWTLLYEDPTGQQFSGATSALLIDGVLIAGSVRADGLLVCKAGGL